MFGLIVARRLLSVLIILQVVLGSAFQDTQAVLDGSFTESAPKVDDSAILAAINKYPDPVDAFISLRPESEAELAEPRFLKIFGEKEPQWMTEGDKLRLRRRGKKFMDVTDHQSFYEHQEVDAWAGKARESWFDLLV